MKQMLILLICALFIFSAVLAYAAPVGNIATAKALKKGLVIKDEESQFGIAIGPEIDIIFDRNLKDQVEDPGYQFFGGRAGLIVGNKAIIYGLWGVGDAEYEFEISNNEVEWRTETDLVWGAGGTLIVYENEVSVRGEGMLRLGIDGQYRSSDLDIDKVVFGGVNYNPSDAALSGVKFDHKEWQVALEVSYQADRIIPYGGVKYSDIDGKAAATISGREYSRDFEPEQNIGIFAGVDFLITDTVSVYAEGRFIDETAFSAGGTIRF